MSNLSLNSAAYADVGEPLDHTPSVAQTGGDILSLGGGLIGHADRDIAASALGAFRLDGLRKYKKSNSTGPVFAIGDTIVWDESASTAVVVGLDSDGSADIPVAVCVKAAAADEDFVVGWPLQILDRYLAARPFVYEFDCDGDNGDTDEHVLVPAWMNRHGLIVHSCFGLVTEVFAGSTEDQGIVTVEDEDDNAICTLTANDSAADAVDDVIRSSGDIVGASSGDAIQVVAAGKAIQGFVSQQTSGGTPAGKIKVYLRVQPLV